MCNPFAISSFCDSNYFYCFWKTLADDRRQVFLFLFFFLCPFFISFLFSHMLTPADRSQVFSLFLILFISYFFYVPSYLVLCFFSLFPSVSFSQFRTITYGQTWSLFFFLLLVHFLSHKLYNRFSSLFLFFSFGVVLLIFLRATLHTAIHMRLTHIGSLHWGLLETFTHTNVHTIHTQTSL